MEDGCEKLLAQHQSLLNNHHNINNVIKSENSKNQELSDDQTAGGANNQKLDDFEQLLDSASASSNIINKKLVCRNNSEISDDSFLLKSSTGGFSQSEDLSKNVSVNLLNTLSGEASSSGVRSINGSQLLSLTSTTLPELNHPTIGEEEEEEVIKSEFTASTSHVDDFYLNFMDEIKNEWLHFRPKTPPMSSSPTDDILFDSDLTDKTKKFAVELQMLDDAYKETDESGYTDNIYLTQSMSFNFNNKFVGLADETTQENATTSIKTEPMEFMDDSNEGTIKAGIEQDAVKRLLEKYQKDVAKDETLELEIDDIDFDECFTNNESLGCSTFKLLNDDLMETFKSNVGDSKLDNVADVVVVKNEIIDFPQINSVQNIAMKEAPIAELQTHNYVLQYGSPVTSNTVTLSSISSNSNMLSCSPSIDSSMTPATTLFQQQFINSGNAIISQQGQQNKLQPIVYDSNTIVLAAAPNRNNKLNGPSDRNCKFKAIVLLSLQVYS